MKNKNLRFAPPSEDLDVASRIIDRYAFTRKRVLETIQKFGYLPRIFNPYSKTEFIDNAPTLTTSSDRTCAIGTVLIKEMNNMSEYKIRKLTPKECYALMGLKFEDADKAYAVGISDSSLYKQAGNGIVTNCVQLLFEHLYKSQYARNVICMDESHDFTHSMTGGAAAVC